MALSYNTDGILIWPNHIKPRSINLGISQPSLVTRSQSGKKFVNSMNYTKQGIEVAYPPMKEEDFQLYYAAILKLRGNAGLCWFDLIGADSEKMIFKFFGDETLTPLVNGNISLGAGDRITQIPIKGLPVSTVEPIPAGSVISGLGRNYGHVQTVIDCTNSNASGQATLTLADPIVEALVDNQPINVNPTRVLVSIADETFNVDIQTIKYYGFEVQFEFDRTYG